MIVKIIILKKLKFLFSIKVIKKYIMLYFVCLVCAVCFTMSATVDAAVPVIIVLMTLHVVFLAIIAGLQIFGCWSYSTRGPTTIPVVGYGVYYTDCTGHGGRGGRGGRAGRGGRRGHAGHAGHAGHTGHAEYAGQAESDDDVVDMPEEVRGCTRRMYS